MPARPEVARGVLRGARATVLAVTALLLAAIAHLVGGGRLPSVPMLAAVVAPLVWACVALTGRRLGRGALLAALGVAQLMLHEAFMLLSGPSCALPSTLTSIHGMHAMHVMAGMGGPTGALATCTAAGASHPMAMAAGGAAAPLVMLAAHVVATTLTALLLAYGERLLASVPALLLGRLVRLLAGAAAPAWPSVVRHPALDRQPRRYDPADGVLRRGPPQAYGAVAIA